MTSDRYEEYRRQALLNPKTCYWLEPEPKNLFEKLRWKRFPKTKPAPIKKLYTEPEILELMLTSIYHIC